MNDPFREKTYKTRNKEGKNVSGKMLVETRSQKASEDERAMLNVEINPHPALDENRVKR